MRTVQEPRLSHHDQWRLACDLSAPGPAPAEEEEGDTRFGKRWYMTVIALLYIGRRGGSLSTYKRIIPLSGLIISFCLNITLLLRRPAQVQQLQQIQGAVCKWEN